MTSAGEKENFGGGERDRTDDLLVANQALSQLSYTPEQNFLYSNLTENFNKF